MERVVFGVDRRVVSEAKLLASLGRIAKAFDEPAKELVCVVADLTGDIQWLTFRASSWARGEALAAGFFEDMFSLDKLELLSGKRHEMLRGDVRFTWFRGGKVAVEIHSDANQVAVVGKVTPKVKREGDAESFTLAAIGWSGAVPWDGFGTSSRRVALRSNGEVVVAPAIAPGGKKLPPVAVTRGAGEAGFEHVRERATERFDVKRTAAANLGKPVKVDIRVGSKGDWVDLSKTPVVTGQISVFDDWDGEYGVEVVDLGGVREMKYPCKLELTGEAKGLVGKQLLRADTITIGDNFVGRIDLPVLETVREATFALPSYGDGKLELPALASAKKITLTIHDAKFSIRLPALADADLVIDVKRAGKATIAQSVLDIPKLDRKRISIVGDACKAAIRSLLESPSRPDKTANKQRRESRAL